MSCMTSKKKCQACAVEDLNKGTRNSQIPIINRIKLINYVQITLGPNLHYTSLTIWYCAILTNQQNYILKRRPNQEDVQRFSVYMNSQAGSWQNFHCIFDDEKSCLV